MDIKKLFPLFFIVAGFGSLNAQDADFGDITKEDLLVAKNPIEPEAKAAVLNSYKEIYFERSYSGLNLITEVKRRIKFYQDSNEAFEHATERIRLYEDVEDEKVINIEGKTYNLVNGKIQETKLKNQAVFDKQLNEYIEQVSFTMPAVKKGSIIEYEYEIISPYFWDMDEIVFQYNIPVMQASANIYSPSNFLFNRIYKGSVLIDKSESEKTDHRFGGRVNVNSYRAKNIPALKDEKFVDNIKNYRSGIIYELVYVKFPNGESKRFSVSWEDVAKTIAESDDYEEKLDNKGVYREDLDKLLASETDSLQILKTLFDYVKTNIKWNEYYGKFFYNGMRKAYKEHKGNVADINLTLVSMLRYAGIEAYPLVISTRDNLKPTFPTLDQLNYVIAVAEVGGKQYFMDATETYSKLNLLPIRDYNGRGILIDHDNWGFVNLVQPPKSNMTRLVNIKLNKDLSASGEVMTRFSNHYAYLYRKKINATSKESYIQNLESKWNNVVIENYQSEDKVTKKFVKSSYTFTHENALQKAGDKLFFQPLLFLAKDENPFKAKTREFPINFGYPFQDKTLVNIEIPKNYTIASLPQSTRIIFGDDLGRFDYLVSKNGNHIAISVNFEINKNEIHSAHYKYLKTFYDQMIQKQLEKIVLTKKQT